MSNFSVLSQQSLDDEEVPYLRVANVQRGYLDLREIKLIRVPANKLVGLFADRLDARHTAARTRVEKLTPSLLGKAFRGDLVPQDPNDEPASELLACIRSQRGEPVSAKIRRSRKTAIRHS